MKGCYVQRQSSELVKYGQEEQEKYSSKSKSESPRGSNSRTDSSKLPYLV